MSRRFQFSLRALLVAMLVVAAFFGGMALQRRIDNRPLSIEVRATYDSDGSHCTTKALVLSDGTEWFRTERSVK